MKLVRTIQGERSTVIEAPETATIIGIFASTVRGAIVGAEGVMPPSIKATLSLTIKLFRDSLADVR